MSDSVEQNFVRSFINYLKSKVDSQSFSSDAQESCEVAIQCLEAAFDLNDNQLENIEQPTANTDDAPSSSSIDDIKPWDPKTIDLFQLYETHYLEIDSDNLKLAETIKNRGNELMKEGKYNEALLQYNRAVTYDPKNPIFYCNRAAAYIRLGENNRAVTDCKTALVYNSNYSKAYGRLGIAYSNIGKYAEAEQAYAKAVELEPGNQDYINNLEAARNAINQARTFLPQLTGRINTTLSNPAIRQLFNINDIDLEQLQSMSQNPIVMNTIGQVFSNLQNSVGNNETDGGGPAPTIPNEMMNLFQSFVQQLATGSGSQNSNSNVNTNDSSNDQQSNQQ